MKEWSYEEATQVFPRGHRARRAHGQRGGQRVRVAVGSHRIDHIREEGEVRLDEHGNAMTMVGASQGVTAQKQEQAAHRESEERFRATFGQAAVGMPPVR